MIKANFNSYNAYVTDTVYQWDLDRELVINGLNLTVAPEVHFSNANMDKAIVRQSTLKDHIVSVAIPNSLLQEPLPIKAHIGVYEGDTFKVIELVEIPVIPKTRPSDYQIQNSDEEIYSFEALKNAIANMVKVSDFNSNNTAISARIDNIIAHNNDTEANTELVDIRTGADGLVYNSAGEAVRGQIADIYTLIDTLNEQTENLKKFSGTGKTMGILGDSYSTYEKWIPNEYVTWYANSGNSQENDVESVCDTWWYQLSKETRLSLLFNSSYSGSTICNTSDLSAHSFIARMKNDFGEEKVLQPKPDIIFVFGGTNDSWASSPIGELMYSDWTDEDLKSFLPAFCYILDYLKIWNPHARIINITNTELSYEITNGMKTACEHYNIENLILNDIAKENGHPNKVGMISIKNQILEVL